MSSRDNEKPKYTDRVKNYIKGVRSELKNTTIATVFPVSIYQI
jgi:hypothetical protein